MNDTQIADKLKTAYSGGSTLPALAEKYGVYATDIWRAIRKDYVSPSLRRAVDPPRKRTRIIVEVSPEVRAWWDAELERSNLYPRKLLYWCIRAYCEVYEQETP